jgi:glutamate-1-semialdehyde 2,1-aminomutase
MISKKSEELFRRAEKKIPGGVNSPVRAFRSVGRNLLFIARSSGARLWDVDGNEFIDYVGSWGPMILGHGHEKVLEAIQQAAANGTNGQFRHRSNDECNTAGTCVHRPR